mmetsp:Transcript_16375/g.27684  ORF Transcript_16375/g.27684 Transcript_16375/m.27684 type:complete len:178 (-) Transcript_16375:159-692(-)
MFMCYVRVSHDHTFQALRIANRPTFYGNSAIKAAANRGYGEERRSNDDDDSGGSGVGGRDIFENVDVENRYHALYEERMNPFDQFSQREKQRKLQELTVADRIVLNTAMALVSNQTGRNFLLMYLGLMHLLMFFIIYYTAHNVHSGCDPSLDHMSAAETAVLAAGDHPAAKATTFHL